MTENGENLSQSHSQTAFETNKTLRSIEKEDKLTNCCNGDFVSLLETTCIYKTI